jgi:hypothetical protein
MDQKANAVEARWGRGGNGTGVRQGPDMGSRGREFILGDAQAARASMGEIATDDDDRRIEGTSEGEGEAIADVEPGGVAAASP